MITLIAAVNHNFLLGKDNNIPWHVQGDLAYFKEQTMHKTLLMGRKTYESLPKKLKGRKIFVLTKQRNYRVEDEDVSVIHDVSDLIKTYKQSDKELMVAGGGLIYELMMPFADKLLLSIIDDHQQGDVYFPAIDPSQFECVDEINKESFVVLEYKRYV